MKNANILTLLEAAAFLEKQDEQINESNSPNDLVVEWISPDNLQSSQHVSCASGKTKYAKEHSSKKRMHHNELERLRRRELRARVENLRKLVPGMERSSTQLLLASTMKYIKLLTVESDKLKLEEQCAEKKRSLLIKTLHKLRNSLVKDSAILSTSAPAASSSLASTYIDSNGRKNKTNNNNDDNNNNKTLEDSNCSVSLRSSTSSGFSDSSYSDMSDCSVNSGMSYEDEDCWTIERRKLHHSTSSDSSLSLAASISEDGVFARQSQDIKVGSDEQFISDEEDDKKKGCSTRFKHSRRRRHRRSSCTVSFCEQYFADMVVEVENDNDPDDDSGININVGRRMRSKTFTEGTEYVDDEQM